MSSTEGLGRQEKLMFIKYRVYLHPGFRDFHILGHYLKLYSRGFRDVKITCSCHVIINNNEVFC